MRNRRVLRALRAADQRRRRQIADAGHALQIRGEAVVAAVRDIVDPPVRARRAIAAARQAVANPRRESGCSAWLPADGSPARRGAAARAAIAPDHRCRERAGCTTRQPRASAHTRSAFSAASRRTARSDWAPAACPRSPCAPPVAIHPRGTHVNQALDRSLEFTEKPLEAPIVSAVARGRHEVVQQICRSIRRA